MLIEKKGLLNSWIVCHCFKFDKLFSVLKEYTHIESWSECKN